MMYVGDFPEDHVAVIIPFSTFSSDDPSASVTITDLVDADIKVAKDGAATPISTDGATVVIDLDSIAGNHVITIDTSVDAAYSTGSEYQVRIEGTTVDGGTVNAWVGCFSIERAGGVLALTKLIKTTTDKFVFTVANQVDANAQYWNDAQITTALETSADIVDAWETQSQADPTGFHVNVKEVNATAQTAGDIPALINALNDAPAVSVADILTTQMTESYAADGTAPTLTESLMMIQQILGDFTIIGTTLSVKGVDGSTEKATFTLDDATNPTSVTRAT